MNYNQTFQSGNVTTVKFFTKELSAGLLIILFLYTAITKLLDYTNFAIVIDQSHILTGYGSYIAVLVPIIEFIIVLCLFLPTTKRFGFLLSIFILAAFTGYIIYMLLTASKLPCHCGGVIDRMTWKQHILFNLFFLLISIYGFFRSKQS